MLREIIEAAKLKSSSRTTAADYSIAISMNKVEDQKMCKQMSLMTR